jgi:hypothetical protein
MNKRSNNDIWMTHVNLLNLRQIYDLDGFVSYFLRK